MRPLIVSLLFVSMTSMTVLGHFVFVVPAPGAATAAVILSETLAADPQVDVGLIAGATLSLRDSAGRETPLSLTRAEHAFVVPIAPPALGLVPGVVHGVVDLGVMKSGDSSYALRYHPKTILGDPFATSPVLVGHTPVEIAAIGHAGSLRLELLVDGKPYPATEVTVIPPDGMQKTIKTDAEGRTEVFAQRGRYAAWARYWEATRGEVRGQAYEQIRHYATLVFDAGTLAPAGSNGSVAPRDEVAASRFATLPEAASSFGAAVSDGWLYVYGGHVVPTHSYSTAAVSGRFNRLNLADGKTWESLPGGPPLQGMNLAAHGGKIYRVGGMQPQSKPGEPQDIRSIADVARFDPATRRWDALPPLPVPRSSHDVVIVGDTLIVVGGWTLNSSQPTQWPDRMDLLDLAAPTLAWKRVPQPFKRRALVAGSLDGTVYAIGGFDEKSRVVHAVSIFDVASGRWSNGPDLPGGALNGFGPAACALDGRLYVSVDDGGIYRLDRAAGKWDKVGKATPRIVHRLVPNGRQLLILGGARASSNVDLIEAIDVAP